MQAALALCISAILWQWSAPLTAPWKFHTGDDPRWAAAAFDDRTWATLDLTAPASANDGDQGITHYASGWGAQGFSGYHGFAWYRIRVMSPRVNDDLVLLGPAMVDNAYQVYANGTLLGGIGDFTKLSPTVYGIHPMRFAFSADSAKPIVVAVRVWMAPWAAGPRSGGMHVAPIMGTAASADPAYKVQWFEKIRAFALEIAQAFFFIVLAAAALALFRFDRRDDGLAYLAAALLLTASWRANLAIYWLSSRESIEIFFYTTIVLLVPVTLCAWTLAWYRLLRIRTSSWIPSVALIMTALYIIAEFLRRPLFNGGFLSPVAPAAAMVSRLDRYAFLALLVFIVYLGFREHRRETWTALPSIILISIGQFAPELLALGVPGIWFPFGMGVSLANWAYLLSTFTIAALLWTRLLKSDFAVRRLASVVNDSMIRRTFIAVVTFALFALPLLAPADDAMVDKPLAVYFLYAGVNARIDTIEVSKTRTNNAALKDMEQNDNAPGVVVVHMSVQNPTSNQDISIPGSIWSWELADGSLRDMGAADHEYAGKSLTDVPDSLHPNETVQLTYVFAWTGSPLTKLFLKRNSGGNSDGTGAQYVRFQIKPSDLKQLQ